jgi:hypothetical protein
VLLPMIATDFQALSLLLSLGLQSPVMKLRSTCIKIIGTLLRTALPKSRLDMSYDTSGEGVSWTSKRGDVGASILWMKGCMQALLSCANDVEVEVGLIRWLLAFSCAVCSIYRISDSVDDQCHLVLCAVLCLVCIDNIHHCKSLRYDWRQLDK